MKMEADAVTIRANVPSCDEPDELPSPNAEEDDVFYPMEFEDHWENPSTCLTSHYSSAADDHPAGFSTHHKPVWPHNRQSIVSAVCWFETVPEEDENSVATAEEVKLEETAVAEPEVLYTDKYKDFKVENGDGGRETCWSWVVLVCSCLLVIFILGIPPTFGIIYEEPLSVFSTDATLTSWIFNLAKSFFFFAGCVSGPISTLFGHRILVAGVVVGSLGLVGSSFATHPYIFFLTHSIMVSMGFGFANFVCYLNLQKHFPKRRGLATGAYMASKACARSIVPQLANLLTTHYGYQWMMRILAAISLNGVFLGLIVTSKCSKKESAVEMAIPVSKDQGQEGLEEPSKRRKRCCCCYPASIICCPCFNTKAISQKKFKDSCDFTVFKEPAFIALTTIDCLLGMTMENMSWVLPFYAQERGMDVLLGATLLTVTAGCDFVGRFIIPPLFDVKCLDYQCVFTFLLIVAAGASVGIGLQPPLEVTLVLCGIFGLAQSGTTGMPNVLLINYLSLDRFPSSMSAKTLFKFLFFCLAPVIGFLVDATGSYSTCLFIFSGLLILTAVLSGLFPYIVKKCSHG